MLEAHDDIAAKNYEAIPDVFPIFSAPPPQEVLNSKVSDAIRMVGIRKNADEPLVRMFSRFIGVIARTNKRALWEKNVGPFGASPRYMYVIAFNNSREFA